MAFGMNFFRKYRGRFLLVIAVFLMLVWFVGGAMTRLFTPDISAGTMFGQSVTQEKYQGTLQVLQLLRRDQRPTDEDVWRFLVTEHEADRLGVKVTDDEVINTVRNWVQQSTNASKENLDNAYKVVLEKLRTSDRYVRYAMARQMRVGKLRSMVGGASLVTDADAWKVFVEEKTSLKLKTLRVPLERFQAQVPQPGDAALVAYFDANKQVYLVPAKATVEYIAALRSEFEKTFPVSDEEVADYYEQRKGEDYLKPPTPPSTDSQLAASTDSAVPAADGSTAPALVASSSTDATLKDEDIYKPLADVAAEIRTKLTEQKAKGAIIDAQVDAVQQKDRTLKDIAALYGLPFFSAGPFVKEDRGAISGLADAAAPDKTPVVEDIFTNKVGDYQSAEGPNGYFLYRTVALEPEREPTVDEVKDRVRADYVKAEAKKLASAEAVKVLDEIKAKGWDNILSNTGYNVIEMPVARTGQHAELFKAAIALKTGDFGGPVTEPDGIYDFQVVDRTEPKAAEFETEKPWIKFSLSMNGKYGLIQEWENDLYKRANVKSQVTSATPPPQSPADDMPDF